MRAAGLVVVLLATGAAAEQWADEQRITALVEARPLPRWGVTGGLQLGVISAGTVGPVFGARLGGRLRLTEHVAMSLQAQWDHYLFDATPFSFPSPSELELIPVHFLSVLASIDLFTVSAFEHLFEPELAFSLVGGIRTLPGIPPSMAPPLGGLPRFPVRATFGPQIQLLRLRPSAMWFPVSLQMLFGVEEQGLFFSQLVVGVGL